MTNSHIPSFQDLFVDELITRSGSKSNLVELLQNELNLASTAAYNRISGKILLTMSEAQRLAKIYSISLDQYILPHYSRVTFTSDALRKLPSSYDQYLTNVVQVLKHLNKLPNLTTTSIGNEIPLFHYASFPNLYHFKLYYWKQTFWQFGNHEQQFSLGSKEVDQDIHNKTQVIGDEYYSMNSTEIWTIDLFTPILQQIKYFLELGSFSDNEDALTLIEDVKKMSARLQSFCQTGRKVMNNSLATNSTIEVYYNELHDGTDALLFDSGEMTFSFIKYDGPNFIRTQQSEFGTYSKKWISNIINKSSGISARDERHRRMFFKKVNDKIQKAEGKIRHIIGGMD